MRYIVPLLGLILASSSALATDKLTVTVSGIGADQRIAPEFAYCIPGKDKPSVPEGKDQSPQVQWNAGPVGTKSYAVIVVDTEVPTDFTDAGKEGKTISAAMKRQDFYHWILVDIPATTTTLPAGAFGKDGAAPLGRHGLNDYPKFLGMELNAKTIADNSRYSGPCPPWNDEKMHRYHFRVYALDVEKLPGLNTPFTGQQAIAALSKHVLAEGEALGLYSLYNKK